MHRPEPQHPILYRERVTPPLWLWVCVTLLVLSLIPVLVVVVHPAALLVVIGLAGTAAAFGLVRSTPTIELSTVELRAGRATIPVAAVGRAAALTTERARSLRGPDFEPRAYHLIRGWIEGAVLVEIRDPADPTPYWYLNTRHPADLAAAIAGATAGTPR